MQGLGKPGSRSPHRDNDMVENRFRDASMHVTGEAYGSVEDVQELQKKLGWIPRPQWCPLVLLEALKPESREAILASRRDEGT